jgi:membrane protein implicated in regulation of membrane protease activity
MDLIWGFFLISALIGGALFVARMALFFFGGDLHGDSSDAHAGHFHFDGGDAHSGGLGDTDVSFQFLSLQGLTAFFMMFGLVGMALYAAGQGSVVSIAGGLVAGVFTVWVVSKVFIGFQALQSDGTIRIENAIGKEGSVYLTIPEGEVGKVNVTVQGRLSEFEAVSLNKKKIETGQRVKIVYVIGRDRLVVERILHNK